MVLILDDLRPVVDPQPREEKVVKLGVSPSVGKHPLGLSVDVFGRCQLAFLGGSGERGIGQRVPEAKGKPVGDVKSREFTIGCQNRLTIEEPRRGKRQEERSLEPGVEVGCGCEGRGDKSLL